MKHREEEKLDSALEVIIKAPQSSVENLQNPVLREEVKKLRGMLDD